MQSSLPAERGRVQHTPEVLRDYGGRRGPANEDVTEPPLLTRVPEVRRAPAQERVAFLRPVLEEGVPLSRLGREGGIPWRTAQHWLARDRRGGTPPTNAAGSTPLNPALYTCAALAHPARRLLSTYPCGYHKPKRAAAARRARPALAWTDLPCRGPEIQESSFGAPTVSVMETVLS